MRDTRRDTRKVILVTGASSGIGSATALRLARDGHIVYAGVLCADRFELEHCHPVELDVRKQCDMDIVIARIISEQGRLDVLICCAGQAILGAIDELTPEESQNLFQVNVFGILTLVQKILPIMRNERRGHIIAISSALGIESSGFFGVYAATKFALEALMSSFSTVSHFWNIDVSIVEPGAVCTNIINPTRFGSYYQPACNPYGNFAANAAKFLGDIISHGTSPADIAEKILKIIKAPNTRLRHQTCQFSKEIAQKHLKDPSGSKWRDDHRKLMEVFFREDSSENI